MKAFHSNYYPLQYPVRNSRPESHRGLYSQSSYPNHVPFDPFWDQEAWPPLPYSPNTSFTYQINTPNSKPHIDRDSRPQSNMGLYSQSSLPHHAPFDPFWDQEAWPALPNPRNTYHWNTFNTKLPKTTLIPFDQFMSLTFDSVPPHLKARGLRVLRIPSRPHLKQTKHTDDKTYNLGKEIAKMVQIRHHIQNWDPIPPSLTKKISLITQNICPPLTNKALQDKYKLLGQEFGSKIAEITHSHLRHHHDLLLGSLNSTDPSGLPGSLTIATKILKDRFGRLTPSLENLLKRAGDQVGVFIFSSPESSQASSPVSNLAPAELDITLPTVPPPPQFSDVALPTFSPPQALFLTPDPTPPSPVHKRDHTELPSTFRSQVSSPLPGLQSWLKYKN